MVDKGINVIFFVVIFVVFYFLFRNLGRFYREFGSLVLGSVIGVRLLGLVYLGVVGIRFGFLFRSLSRSGSSRLG